MKTQKFKQTELKKRLKEIEKLPLTMECKILSIANSDNSENFNKYKEDLLLQFQNIIESYKKLSDGDKTLGCISQEILLNSAIEGLLKIILFFDEPYDYLMIERKNRSLGKLKDKIIKKIKEKEKNEEKNKDKIKVITAVLGLINELRNTFVHFPFYSEKDYRFEYIYFQLIAYLIETFGYWDQLDEKICNYIKEKAREKPEGIDLLRGYKLFEDETNQNQLQTN